MLGRYLRTKGLVGDVPPWWVTVKAARYLGVPPWELEQQPVAWTLVALAAESAEATAQEQGR